MNKIKSFKIILLFSLSALQFFTFSTPEKVVPITFTNTIENPISVWIRAVDEKISKNEPFVFELPQAEGEILGTATYNFNAPDKIQIILQEISQVETKQRKKLVTRGTIGKFPNKTIILTETDQAIEVVLKKEKGKNIITAKKCLCECRDI